MISVLLVEHDSAVAELARRYLAREGFAVRVAGTLADAESAFAEVGMGGYSPDAMVLDLTMPGLRPREIRRALSEPDGRGTAGAAGSRGTRKRAPARPLVCLTGPGGLRPREVGVGESACLRRPFGPRHLVAQVRAAMAARAPGGGRTLARGRGASGSSGGSGSDGSGSGGSGSGGSPGVAEGRREGHHEAAQRFAQVPLTATERELLAFLLANRGRVFSRERLLAALGDTPAGPRAVDVYVAQLRAKLGERSPIRTVRGIGYSAEL